MAIFSFEIIGVAGSFLSYVFICLFNHMNLTSSFFIKL